MTQEDINELIDKSTPQWLSDQRLSEDGYKSALPDCRATIKAPAAEIAELKAVIKVLARRLSLDEWKLATVCGTSSDFNNSTVLAREWAEQQVKDTP